MKNVKGKILGRKVLSFILTATLFLGLMPGNILTVSAEGTDTIISDELIVESVSSNDASATIVCTCETDDPTYHAPFCDLYELPENPQCFCVEKCTEDSLNEWCDVCYGVGVEGCEGEAPLLSENVMAIYASASTPSVDGDTILANGTPITIEAGSTSGTSVWYMNGSTKTYLVENQDLSDTRIFGGCYGTGLDSDTHITMTGGSVESIFGGGLAETADADIAYVNNVNISISGGTVEKYVCASLMYMVKGNVTISVTGGTIGDVIGCLFYRQSYVTSDYEQCKVFGSSTVTITGGTVSRVKIGGGYCPVDGTKTAVITISGVTLVPDSAQNVTTEYHNLLVNNETDLIIKGNVTLPENTKLIIPAGKTLTLDDNSVSAPYGIVNNGTLDIKSGCTNSYEIENNGTLNITTPYTNSEGIVNNGTINLSKPILDNMPTGNGTINRNTAYISGISSVSSISVRMDDHDYTLENGYYETADGKLYLWLPSGDAVVSVNGSVYLGTTNEGTAVELLSYIAVEDIATVSSRIPMGINHDLSRYTVTNADATYKTIEWSVVNANSTGAVITDTALKATAAGTATIRATVRNGQAYGTAYTKDFIVEFYEATEISVGLGSVTISEKDDDTITVAGGGLSTGSKDYPKDESIRIIGSTTENTITIESGATVNLILTDVAINYAGSENAPISVQSGARLNLTLEGTNVLSTALGTEAYSAALCVPEGAELVITESSTGTLKATGGASGAGIGGGSRNAGGNITINGGTVTATGGSSGAGIGGGHSGAGGSITINGGTVTATAGNYGAGIGGGYNGVGGSITINGGTVTATGGKWGAGIGGGYGSNGAGGTIIITGGIVNAKCGGAYGAGIGGGHKGAGGAITIKGGTVTAQGGQYNSSGGIGYGSSGSGGTLTITGGNINGTYNITPTNGSNEVSCYTCKFIGDSEDMAGKTVTAIEVNSVSYQYGLEDVVTFDGDSENEGYFNCYLPADSKITSITVSDTTYICRGEDGICYVDHTWEDATCSIAEHCTVCDKTRGETLSHNYEDGVCTYCSKDANGVFHIKTTNKLVAFAQSVNAGNKDVDAVLDADIDMTGVAWTPICQTVSFHETAATDIGYSGTFDGNGHTISNLNVTGISGGTYSYGLFGTVSGTVENLGMVNYTYTMGTASDARAGSVAGQVLTGGTITNCYSVGHTVTTSNNIAGGIAGCNYGGTISNCYALNGSVSGYDTRWGGVVGDCQKDDNTVGGTVSNCYTDDTRVVSTQNSSAIIAKCEVMDDAAFASGEVAYLLNDGKTDGTQSWYQTLKTDTYPVPDNTHGTVYSIFACDGTTPAGYSNENKNEPHIDENRDDYCDNCGAIYDGIGAHLAGYSVSLNGSIGVNFHMDLTQDVLDDNEAYMLFTLPNGTTQKVMVSDAKAKESAVIEGKTYYIFTCNVAAKEMTDTIQAQLITSDGSKTQVYEYSVREYADRILSGNYDAETQELVKAMLHYGAYSQEWFDYNTTNLANAGLETLDLSEANDWDGFDPIITNDDEVGSFTSAYLTLESDTAINLKFKLADGVSFEDLRVVVEDPLANVVPVTTVTTENVCLITLTGIKASDLDTTYDFSVTDGEGNESYISYSAMSYACAVANSEMDQKLKNVTAALRIFNLRANDKFED